MQKRTRSYHSQYKFNVYSAISLCNYNQVCLLLVFFTIKMPLNHIRLKVISIRCCYPVHSCLNYSER